MQMPLEQFGLASSPLFFLILIWSLIWKGLGLWYSAKNNQKNWFIVMLIINIAGIVEILYLFVFAKKKLKLSELKFWEKS